MPPLAARLADVGAALVRCPRRAGWIRRRSCPGGTPARRSFTTLVSTYGTVPYPDVDPTFLAGAAYVLMFGMMFGDAGQGLLLLLAGLVIRARAAAAVRRLASDVAVRRRRRPSRAPRSACCTGSSSDHRGAAGDLAGAVGGADPPAGGGRRLGAVLLAGAYLLAIVNRWREGGPATRCTPRRASPVPRCSSGSAGVTGYYLLGESSSWGWEWVASWPGSVLAGAGFVAGAGGRATGLFQAAIELFDSVVRLGSNVVSFARLAAFGLTHAALGWLVWSGTVALWLLGPLGMVGAVVLFVVGNA